MDDVIARTAEIMVVTRKSMCEVTRTVGVTVELGVKAQRRSEMWSERDVERRRWSDARWVEKTERETSARGGGWRRGEGG